MKIEHTKEWWLKFAELEGDSEVGAGRMCEHEIDELIYSAQRGFSPDAWAKGEQFVIDYYYKPGTVSTFKQALEQSPNEATDYIELASKVAGMLDAKDKELMKAIVKAKGWNPGCDTWTLEKTLSQIGYATEQKYTASDMYQARNAERDRWVKDNKALKAELARQMTNYGKLTAKYGDLKKAFRSWRKQADLSKQVREELDKLKKSINGI